MPIPSLELDESQKRLEDAVMLELELKKGIAPENPDPDTPPVPTVQVTSLLFPSKQILLPVPDPSPVSDTSDDDVSDPPTPKLPDIFDVPVTSSVYWGEELPIPTLKLVGSK